MQFYRCLLVVLALAGALGSALAQTTSFTYQGRLSGPGGPASGPYDFQFRVFNAATAGVQQGDALVTNGVLVTQGEFSVTLDFGNLFPGGDRWLDIAVKQGGTEVFSPLTPRQRFASTPYAVRALDANTAVTATAVANGSVGPNAVQSGAIGSLQIADGSIAPEDLSGAILTNLFWQMAGNAGTVPALHYLGTTDGTPLVLRSLGGVGINTTNPVTALDVNGDASFYHSLTLDALELNDGLTIPGLLFGADSGESIASKRTAGGNQWGLDFYTAAVPRLSIANDGNVGVGTTAPSEKLHVTGRFLRVDGAGNEQAYLGGDGTGANVQLGSLNPEIGNVALWNAGNGTYMHLYVKALTIVGGADIAEPFAMSDENVVPGTVVVIDPQHPGRLKRSTCAYDKKVAGIVSGAGGIHPGMSLIQADQLEAGKNVALTGRVYVYADASSEEIEPGDLLTTSDTAGHAMKAEDERRSHGTILGKAMSGLKHGRGLVLVLVTLH